MVTWRLGNVSAHADMSRSPIARNKTINITFEPNDALLIHKHRLPYKTEKIKSTVEFFSKNIEVFGERLTAKQIFGFRPES